MKRLSICIVAVVLSFSITMSAQGHKVSFDEYPSTSYGNPITNEYASFGIHFKSGDATPQELGISLYGGTVFTATSWPGSVFPVLPPGSQYLGLDKPQGETVITGIAIEFDKLSTQLGFAYCRPGNNLSTYTTVNIYFYNTALGMYHPA